MLYKIKYFLKIWPAFMLLLFPFLAASPLHSKMQRKETSTGGEQRGLKVL